MSRKKFILCLLAATAFLVGYGAAAKAYPAGGVHGRGEFRGYRTNTFDDEGTYVLRQAYFGEAIRPNVEGDVEEFISFILYTKLDLDGNGSATTQDKRGATFIIQTMLGVPTSQRSNRPSTAQIDEWKRRVRYASSRGWITWRTNYTFSINSMYQGTHGGANPDDDAFYDERDTRPAILFRNGSGTVVYALKWECANPVGSSSLGPIPDDANYSITGRTTVSNASPRPGDTITFRHYVRNNGPTSTSPTNVWWIAINSLTNTNVAGPASSGVYSAGQEKNVNNENVTIPAGTPPGTRYCRRVGWDPVNATGGHDGRGTPVCATVRYDFNLTPIITVLVNGAPPSGSVAEQGDNVTFTYSVNNAGTTISQNTACNIFGRNVAGSYTPPAAPNGSSAGGYSPPATGCPRTFPANATTTLTTETIASAPVNTTICRSLFINPNAPGGVSEGTETCVRVVARPYLKVYGGDVSVGGGLATAPNTCTNNSNARIVTWNKGGGGGYAGAGAQYAAFALNAINYFASAQAAGSSAAAPTGLSFANTATNVGSGLFGGSFGSAPCIRDYYADKPASTSSLGNTVNVSPLVTGAYARSGGTVISGGNVNPGQRITVYVDGDVFITGNVTFPGSWSYDNIPLFQLVVRGNIFISSNVTQLDGIYIAQPNGANGGTIYTCATGSVMLPLSGNMYTTCDTKLTINGAFVARNVEFLRTLGTVSRAGAGEVATSSNIAEVFNFGPALWIPQPALSGGDAGKYDAITSLPPVL